MTAPPVHVHATALVVGERGILIRGPSGSGKTSLALALLADAGRERRFARLVGDDRVGLQAAGARVVARPHPAIAGQVECRGIGVRIVPHEPACVLDLVVDLVVDPAQLGPRLPECPPAVSLCGIDVPALSLMAEAGARDNGARVLALLFALR